jgi:hypothetical protein
VIPAQNATKSTLNTAFFVFESLRSEEVCRLGSAVCMDMQSHSRLNLTRNFHAMPLSVCVLLSVHAVCAHERALSALKPYMHDGHRPTQSALKRRSSVGPICPLGRAPPVPNETHILT